MCSRFVLRSMQGPTPSLIFNRFLSLTQVQFSAATKLKEKTSSTPKSEKSAASTEQPSTPPIAKANDVPVENKNSIPPPTTGANDPNKTYSEKIHRLVDEISKLSLVDVMDLNELLKVSRVFLVEKRLFMTILISCISFQKTLKIQDVPIVASGGASAAAPPPAAVCLVVLWLIGIVCFLFVLYFRKK